MKSQKNIQKNLILSSFCLREELQYFHKIEYMKTLLENLHKPKKITRKEKIKI